MAKAKTLGKPAEIQRPKGARATAGTPRGTRTEALERIFATAIRDGEGFRHGVLGSPRMGKTYHLQEVIEAACEQEICALGLVHDVKRVQAQYHGALRTSAADFAARPPAEQDGQIVVFHQAEGSDSRPSVEEVSALGLRLAQVKFSNCVLVDELYHGMKGRQTWDGPSFQKLLREGSSQGVSTAWTTQIPQSLPTEACDLSETMALFHLQGRSARYAVDTWDLPPEAVALLGRLDRGEFLLIDANEGWDGKVYGPT